MAIDTPAKIAILGAGPIGLEAALYARFLGYDVDIFERGDVASNVRTWGHVRMFSPFSMNTSTLGLAALVAQDESYQPPTPESLLSGREFADAYLLPLANSDLLADHLHLHTTVLSVSRQEHLKGELIGDELRGESSFRILTRDADGGEQNHTADIVIDTTGVYDNARWMGPGGGPAVGESALRDQIEYGVPDVLGSDRERYVRQRVLLVGSGHSAATTAVALAKLAEEESETRVTWVTRRDRDNSGPIKRVANDRLEERARLTDTANELATSGKVTHLPETTVVSVHPEGNGYSVEFTGAHSGPQSFDRIIANIGYRPDNRLTEELQVHQCYATEGPMKLAAALLGSTSADCLDQTSHGPQTLLNPEPNFYVLGAKSYGRNANFLISLGLDQIRELFTIIGDREDLDLYAGAVKLLG